MILGIAFAAGFTLGVLLLPGLLVAAMWFDGRER